MTGKFVLAKDKRGEYHFRLKAGNGEVIATDAGGFVSKASVLNAIEAVRRNAPDAVVVDES